MMSKNLLPIVFFSILNCRQIVVSLKLLLITLSPQLTINN